MNHRLPLLALSLALLIVGGLIFASLPQPAARAQDGDPPSDAQNSEPIVNQAVNFAVTPALEEIGVTPESTDSFRRGRAESTEVRPEQTTSPPLSGETDSRQSLEASIQAAAPEPNVAASASNFEGLSNEDNRNVNGFFINPPDTVGDVGRTQYVQATNLLFRVYDKTTGAALTPARRISVLFASLPASSRCRSRDDGDPIVLYDSFADRWFISQFVAPDSSPTAPSNPPFAQCIAVSQTSDATGPYFVYEFTSPNNKFADYPKYGVWPDAYYSTTNQFGPNASGQQVFRGVGVYAYDREKILRGDPTATYIYFDLDQRFPNQTPRGMLPSDADGFLLPPAGAPNVFSYYNANEFFNETDSLRLFDFRANFANPGASSFTERADSPLAVAAFDPLNPSNAPTFRNDIEQPRPAPASAYLDSIGDRLMNRLQYRNFGSFESLTVNHTVNAGTRTPNSFPSIDQYRAAPRYYQLRRVTPSGNFTIQNQGTFSPDTNERWMGSAALDGQGNLALGYSVSSLSVFPSIRYAGRLAADAPDTLQSEQSIQVGTGVQTNFTGLASRWGDYSSMNVDPTDDCTFFYTQEYYQTTDRTPTTQPFGVNWQTRVGSFKFAQCVVPARGTLSVAATNCDTGQPVQGASVVVDGNLIGTTLADGSLLANLAPGTYTVVISTPGSSTSSTQTVTITDGATTAINACPAQTARLGGVSVRSQIMMALWAQRLQWPLLAR
ncbi:MAG: PEGA domain-containing protein [Pyrinomonadaceae bacterium]